jgi:hypothetical protein
VAAPALRVLQQQSPRRRALKHTDDDAGPFLNTIRTWVLAAGRPLLLSPQQTHEIRNDLTLEQILHMVTAIATIHSDPEYVEPILDTALDGRRATGSDQTGG